MNFRSSVAFLAILAVCLPALAVIQPDRPQHPKWLDPQTAPPMMERVDLSRAAEDGSSATPALTLADRYRSRVTESWDVMVDPRTGKPALVYGSGIPMYPGRGNNLAEAGRSLSLDELGEIDLERLDVDVRDFLQANPELLPERGDLSLDPKRSSSRESGRLVSMVYQWTYGGVPVEDARVFVRMNSGNVTQFGSERISGIDVKTEPVWDETRAYAALTEYAGHAESARPFNEPKLLIQVEPAVSETGKDVLGYRLVWEFRYKLPRGLETWAGRVDAATGEVVSFLDSNFYAHASGGVYPRSIFFQDEIVAPLPYKNVDLSAGTTETDAGAGYSYDGLGVTSTMSGPWFDVNCQGCDNPIQPLADGYPGNGRIDFGIGGDEESGNGVSTPADRNTLYHVNYARQVGLKWLPGETFFQSNNFGLRTNIAASCNATYDGSNLNMYRAGGNCNNTGQISDVVYHEYGHGVDQNTLGGDGGTGEGTADVVSMHITLSPLVGPGFRVTGEPVRDINPLTSSLGVHTNSQANAICGGSVHCIGQVFGQSAWDFANLMVTKYGYYTGWRESERIFFTSLPDAASLLPTSPSSIYMAYVQADDDNGNLADGTPNGPEIFSAFDRHEIATTAYTASPLCTRPDQPTLTVTPQCDNFDLSWNFSPGAAGVQILRSELMAERAYIPRGTFAPQQTSFTDTEVMPGVDYHYQILATAPDGCESTVEAPVPARLISQPVLSVTAAIADDIPKGNRSGFADPGEDVDLVISLGNFGDASGEGISGTVVPLTAGVTMLENSPVWQSLPAGASGANVGTIRFTTDDQVVSCGAELRFRYDVTEDTACNTDESYFSVFLGEPDGQGGYVCDPTPACFTPATFNGLDTVSPGVSCGETLLNWNSASTNCQNAEITYNVYRSTDVLFTPDASTLIASGLTGQALQDTLLQPAEVYYYIVRALDTRSGEEQNVVAKSVMSPATPDIVAPVFGGLAQLATGDSCGETVLNWSPALESCNGPVQYQVYRSTDPGFVPDGSTLVGSSLSTSFVDAALTPGVDYTYIVRALDGVGNEGANELRATTIAAITDQIRFATPFEANDEGWFVTDPNDAVRGNWEWGDPEEGASQPEDDATEDGTLCWMTGLPDQLQDGNNNDIDTGTTTLQTVSYDLTGMVDPAVRYKRWFSNAQGAAPGEDVMVIEASGNGGLNWANLETVQDDRIVWVQQEIGLLGVINPTDDMVFRFQASDLGSGSLVDAGIDDFEIVDRDQGCTVCALPSTKVETIGVDRSGNDVTLDWSADPIQATRYAVYRLSGPSFADAVRIGTSDTKSFVHQGAMLAGESFNYRVSAIDPCGNESELK